ncbi:Threonine aldolase [Batrachochytrium dendrobatidis]|nr:Threonine aldolase [Batrachochytrium dendrobatidis]
MTDLRSDTVTKPCPEMLKAMMLAPVGDDVYSEDPTVNLLEQTVAELSGKEAALFCTSGTLSNQIAIRTHLLQPPYSILCDSRAHIFKYEASGVNFHCGAAVIPVTPATSTGHLVAAEVEKHLVLSDDVHYAPTQLICLENTLNGSIFPQSDIESISMLAKTHSIPLHLDGARLWNASAETGISIKNLCKPFDSVSLCFSKGLGAPVGSVLVGSKQHIKKARHLRKLYGGGWRQAGILAGACMFALEHNWPKMKQVHDNAKYFCTKLLNLGFKLESPTETNMIWLDTKPLGMSADDVSQVLEKHNIKTFGGSGSAMRMVLHHQVPRDELEKIVDILKTHISLMTKN